MNSNSPLIPQGSLEEQRPKGRSNIFIAVFAILAFHVVVLGALLLQGCKDRAPANNLADANLAPPGMLPIPTNPPPAVDLGLSPAFPPPPSNNVAPMPVLPPGPTLGPTAPPVVDIGTPTLPAPTAGGMIEHQVAPGESFTTIAKKYNVSVLAIANANPGVDSRRLKIGQKLKIPERVAAAPAIPNSTFGPGAGTAAAVGIYEVKKGDTLTKIALTQKTTVESLKSANNLKTTMIRVGQKLKIPAKAGVATPADPAALTPPTSAGYVTPLPARGTASL